MIKVAKKEGSFDHAVGLTRWNMKMLGVWPESSRYVTARYFFIFILSCALFIHSYLYIANDRNVPMDAIFMISASVPTISKFVFAKLKSKNYDVIIKRMKKDWQNFGNLSKSSKMIMIFYARKARRMNVICITSTALSYFAFVLAPMNDGKNKFRPNLTLRRLPVEGWFPFDEKQSPVFEIIYTTQWVQTFFLISVILAIDSFLCVVVLHACGQFAVLSKRIKNYTGIVKHEKVNNNNGECACLSCIVKNHVSLIEYVKIIEDSFNELILFQLLGDSVLLSVEGYLLVVHAEKNDISGILAYAAYAITATYSLFIYCYLGEYIIEQAEDIRNTAYNLEWYRYTSCSASPLVLLIRSGFSCKITAGRFSVMRLSYYKKIITTSISYISVLKAIK